MTDGGALWSRAKDTIYDRIARSHYPVGSFLPREVDLAEELGVSRNTVREAIRRLVDEGLLKRRKRIGTRVISAGSSSGLILNLDPQVLQNELDKFSSIEILAREKAPLPPELGSLWSDAADEPWLRVEYLRVSSDDAAPLSWSELFLSADLASVGEMIGRRPGHFFRMIEETRHERMAQTRTQIAPVTLGEPLGGLLKLPAQQLGLKVTHAMLNDRGSCREIVRSVYPACHYQFDISFDLKE